MAHTIAQLEAETLRVFNLALALFPHFAARSPMSPIVKTFTKGRRAGSCGTKWGRTTIELNAHQASESDAIHNLTIPHEVAHMVCQVAPVYGTGHNRGWKAVCRALGGDGQRCYDAEARGVTVVRSRRVTEYYYENQNKAGVWVGPVHHARLQERAAYVIRNKTGQRWDGNDYMHQFRDRK